MLRFRGCEELRQRIALSCLSGKPIRVDDIRSDDEAPGLRGFEASLLRLTEKISNGCVVEINETGTSLRFRPGVVTGGAGLAHDCGRERAIGYFVEPLLLMALFAKQALHIELRGLTDGPHDLGVDTLRAVTLPLARSCGAEVALTVKQRAVGPLGHGVVHLKIGNLKRIERPIKLTDEGLVRRVRGVAWTVNMGAQHATSMFQAAKGVLLKLLADVQIFTDVVSARAPPGSDNRPSQGYGIALVAETDAGRFISAERCVSGAALLEARAAQATAADAGEQAACMLLDEVRRGGVVDGAHQSLAITLAALGPPELNRVRLGALSLRAIKTLRHLLDFTGVQFDIKPDAESQTVFLTCIGAGVASLGRRVQ